MRAKAEMAVGVMHVSTPPASTTSAEPSRMSRPASPMALAPAAQAVVTVRDGPVHPNWMLMSPPVALVIIIGTRNGLTRSAPFSANCVTCDSRVMRPPTPVPVTTAQRAGSAPSSPACLAASTAAAKPSWATRS